MDSTPSAAVCSKSADHLVEGIAVLILALPNSWRREDCDKVSIRYVFTCIQCLESSPHGESRPIPCRSVVRSHRIFLNSVHEISGLSERKLSGDKIFRLIQRILALVYVHMHPE